MSARALQGVGGNPGGPAPVMGRESAAVEDSSAWPLDKLTALRLGRRLVAEVAAAPGRRAFVDIDPVADPRDRDADRAGWRRPDARRAFRLTHWDYDELQLDGMDYDIGAVRLRTGTARDESRLLELIVEWGLTPDRFSYPWNTADPR